jgi:transposase InsO family protein
MSEREEFVRLASMEGANLSDLSRRFGVSRKTAYKWLGRWAVGEAGWEDRSRRPHSAPRRTTPEMEALVCNLRRAHPWGGRKIRHRLLADGYAGVPAASSVSAILRRNGLLGPSPRAQRDYLRFEEAAPNNLWQMDFKGHFATGSGRCHPLTVLDDHSRFNLCLAACPDEQGATVQRTLTGVFSRYGLPDRMLMDNGSPWWGYDQDHRHSRLTAWLIRLGIDVSHGRPFHPQTQGKDERFHRTLKLEVLAQRPSWETLAEVQLALNAWRDVYNLYRPHEALGDLTPSARYRPSARRFPASLPAIEYSPADVVRVVSAKGAISFRGHRIFVSEAFQGEPIALRPVGDGAWDVYYCNQRVASVDLTTRPGSNV